MMGPKCHRVFLRHSGFTLIELTMLIVILGILSATALPKFFNVAIFQERAFFDDTLNALRYAQKRAVSTACNVRVRITANQYTLTQPGASNRSQCRSTTAADFTQAVPRPGSADAYNGSQSGVSLSDTDVYFSAKGSASSNATVTVGQFTLTVVQDTGFVYDSTP